MVPPEVWKSEICAGLDSMLVARTPAGCGILLRATDGFQPVRKIGGTNKRVYILTANVFDGGEIAGDLASKLQNAISGEITLTTGVPGVAGVSATCAKTLKLRQVRPLRLETDKLANEGADVPEGVATHVTASAEPDEDEVEYRKGMAMGSVPKPYLDTWARLQLQRTYTFKTHRPPRDQDRYVMIEIALSTATQRRPFLPFLR